MSTPTVERKKKSGGIAFTRPDGAVIQKKEQAPPTPPPQPTKQDTTKALFKIEKSTAKAKLDLVFKKDKIITLEEAKKYRHALKLNDERFVEMKSHMMRFTQAMSRFNKGRGAGKGRQVTKKINRDEEEKQLHFLTLNLNLLAMEVYYSVADEIFNHVNFATPSYIKTLADVLHHQVLMVPLYANLYSLFVQSVFQVLNEADVINLRTNFLEEIVKLCQAQIIADVDSANEVEHESALGHATFFGCLAMRHIIKYDLIHDTITKLLLDPTNFHLELIAKLLIPIGEEYEKLYPNDPCFNLLLSKSIDKTVPGRVRYFLVDFLEARANKWDVTSLLPALHTKKSADKGEGVVFTAKKIPQQRQQAHIKAGDNKFAALMSDDDDEEEEEIEDFDGRQFIRAFVIDNDLDLQAYRVEYIDLLIKGIIVGSSKEVPKALPIFDELVTNNLFDPALARDVLPTIYAEFTTEEMAKEYRSAPSLLASVLAKFVQLDVCNVDFYGQVFTIYNLSVVSTFWKTLSDLGSLAKIGESEFWLNNTWHPRNSSFVDVIYAELPENTLSYLPLYDNLSAVLELFEGDKKPHEIADSIAEETPEEVMDMPDYALGIVEMIISNSNTTALFSAILPLFKKSELPILEWIENYGLVNSRDDIPVLLGEVAAYGHFDLNAFKAANLGPHHAAIVEKL